MTKCEFCETACESRFCSRSCRVSFSWKSRERQRSKRYKPCGFCQTITGNDKYCSNACQRKAQRAPQIEAWLAGEHDGSGPSGWALGWIKNYLIETTGECCDFCGWCERHPLSNKVPVELDHIDGEPTNNTRANLRLLCPNCHSLTETHRAFNGPSSRAQRGLSAREGRVRPYRQKYGQ